MGGRLHRAAGTGGAATCSLGRLRAHVDEEVAVFEAHHGFRWGERDVE
jgi:hypothetical protein